MDIMKREGSTPTSTGSVKHLRDVSEVAALLAEEIVQATSTGLLPEDFDLTAFARRAIASVPQRNALADSIGDFYDTAGLVEWLEISKQALGKRVEKHQMIGCKTADGHWVYPAWQFSDDGDILPGISEVLTVLLSQQDPWAASLWFVSASPNLPGELSAAEWLAKDGDVDTVVTEALRDTERLAS